MKKYIYTLTSIIAAAALHGQATPVYENSSTAVGKSSTISLSKPAGTQAGDLLVTALMLDKGKSIEVTAPSGWTLVRRSNKWKYIGMAVYQRVAGAGDPSTYSFQLDETTKWSAGISRISNVDPDKPINISNRSTGSKGNVKAPSMGTRDDV